MEHHHEDNAHFGNQQESLPFAAMGDQTEAIGIGIVGVSAVDNAGFKFDEHIVECGDGDDEELKYIKETNQSEKQQNLHYDLFKGLGNGDGPGHQHDLEQLHHVMGNGASMNDANGCMDVVSMDVGDEEVEIIKNDGDFSTTSNATTSTTQSPGDEVAHDLLQVEMKIEAEPQQSAFGGFTADGVQDELDEEEPSSLATNGTSSLSENQIQPQASKPEALDIENALGHELSDELNFDHHSMLNPEAKEFVPSFGSNPVSPTTMTAPGFGDFKMGAGDSDSENVPHLTSNEFARHILGDQRSDDDFVAQSPQKGRCVDMEAISLPGENEFENGASQRPHGLEEEELLIGEANNVAVSENTADGNDFQDVNRQSPASFIDHGPETSVDLDNDIATPMQTVENVMEQSIYVESTHNASNEQIEDILNSVQPLPSASDSPNESINTEDELAQQMSYEREIFTAEGMESVSQMNLQNILNSQGCTDEEVSSQEHIEGAAIVETPQDEQQQLQNLGVDERSFLMDTTNPLETSNVSLVAETEASFEIVRNSAAPIMEAMFGEQSNGVVPPQTLAINNENDSHDLFQYNDNRNITPSPHSTEEKHLVEETKEAQQIFAQDEQFGTVEQKFDDMHLTPGHDDDLAQMEQTAGIAAVINDITNPFSMPSEHELPNDHKSSEQLIEPIMAEPLRNEQISFNEQQALPEHDEYPRMSNIIEAFEEHEEPTKSDLKTVEEPIIESKSPAPLFESDVKEVAAPITIIEDVPTVTAAVVAAATAATVAAVSVAAKKSPSTGGGDSDRPKPITKPSATGAVANASNTKLNTEVVKKHAEIKKPPGYATSKPAAPTARPRTAPAKRITDKPATTGASTLAATKSAPVRKTFTARPAPKTTTAPAPRAATASSSALRSGISTSTTTGAARPASASARSNPSMRKVGATGSTTGVVNSTAKLRLTSSNSGNPPPTKPNTLGIGASSTAGGVKAKSLSPRATLTSQLRKTAGGGATAAPAAKSPTKPLSSGTDITSKVSGTFNRTTKTTGRTTTTVTTSSATSSSTTTTTAKRFVARPAPKFNNAATSTTAATVPANSRGSMTSSGSLNGNSKSNVITKRVSSPSKAINSIKSSNTATKSSSSTVLGKLPKAKEASQIKTAKDLKLQGVAVALAADNESDHKTNGTIEEPPHLNGNGNSVENGIHHDETVESNVHAASVISPGPEVINLIDA